MAVSAAIRLRFRVRIHYFYEGRVSTSSIRVLDFYSPPQMTIMNTEMPSTPWTQGCWMSHYEYEGPGSVTSGQNDGHEFMINVALEPGAEVYFSGIRVMVVCDDRHDAELSELSIHDNLQAQQTGCQLAKQWQEDSNKNPSGTLSICTLLFEIADRNDKWGRMNLVLHPPHSLSDLRSLRVLYDYLQLCVAGSSNSFVLSLSIDSTFRGSLKPNNLSHVALVHGAKGIIALPTPKGILAHGVHILPPAASRKPFVHPPEELLHMIFEHATLAKTSTDWRGTLISFALVCRAWRPALDHLFQDFGPNPGRNPPNVLRLAEAVEMNSELGRKIRVFNPSHFRKRKEYSEESYLEFSRAIIKILQSATRVADLQITVTHPSLANEFLRAICCSPEVTNLLIGRGPPSKERYVLSVADILQCMTHWPLLHKVKVFGFSATIDTTDLPAPKCSIVELYLQQGRITPAQLYLMTAASHSTLKHVTFQHISGLTNDRLLTWLAQVGPSLESLTIKFSIVSRAIGEEYAVDIIIPQMEYLYYLDLEGDIATELVLLRYAPRLVEKPPPRFRYALSIENSPGVNPRGLRGRRSLLMPPKAKNQHGLGRAIINKQAKDSRQTRESDLYTTDLDATGRLKSVTQERDLDEFLNTAQLAATDFTAVGTGSERQNVKIIQTPALSASSAHNPFLLSAQEEKDALRRHCENRDKLRVPRRPPWTRDLTPAQLERQERDAFLDWRRSLAELAEEKELLLTPFERNIEVWRQLWRVLERSHLIVQIVDARNPLRFRCEDLESYVLDIEGPEGESSTVTTKFRRKNLLLINKSDLLTKEQRLASCYIASFIADIQRRADDTANATALQQARKEALEAANAAREAEDATSDEEDDSKEEDEDSETSLEPPSSDSEPGDEHDETIYYSAEEPDDSPEDDRTKVLTVLELENLFTMTAPELPPTDGGHSTKLTIGLVGYPNVGKSSTINSLLGEKKVSVSSTPGKTKHFQTIHLTPELVLCDCPGLVFPQFAVQKAELVCDGVLPVDQLRESHGPIALVTKRLGREVLEATYGLAIRRRGEETGIESNDVTAEDVLIAYAIARGFARSGQGNPDESRAARYVLKDYVNAKLLFCHPPPGISEEEFNAATRQNALRRLEGKKKAPVTRVGKGADTFMHPNIPAAIVNDNAPVEGQKSRVLDASFFAGGPVLSSRPFVQGQEFSRAKLYPHQNSVADDGSTITGRRARLMAVLANNPDGTAGPKGKKHHKGNKRVKQRSGKGYD
ncbi:hypothetical protein K439DRAFT_1621336 [Ramaria rubella]|nr:hypothetical protein K439DRAFT_1621336 [Ramaria rubella]